MAPSSASSSSTDSPPPSRMSSPFKEGSSFASLQGAVHRATLASASEVSRPGLVPTTTRSYVMPGEDYSFLEFTHVHGCHNAFDRVLDNMVRKAVIGTAPAMMKELEVLVLGFLMGMDCSATCDLNKDSTTGLLVQFNSTHGSVYTPSVTLPPSASLPTDLQMVIPESIPSTSQVASSVPTVIASSWFPSPGVLAHEWLRLVAYQALSISAPSFLDDLSSGERLLYGSKFKLDRSSDESFVPARGRGRAQSLSPPKKHSASSPGPSATIATPPWEGILMEGRRKKIIVSEVILLDMERRLAPLRILASRPWSRSHCYPCLPHCCPQPMSSPPLHCWFGTYPRLWRAVAILTRRPLGLGIAFMRTRSKTAIPYWHYSLFSPSPPFRLEVTCMD